MSLLVELLMMNKLPLPTGIRRKHKMLDDDEIPEDEGKSKFCRDCGEEKPLSDFYFRLSRGSHLTICKKCFVERKRKDVLPANNWSKQQGVAAKDKILGCILSAGRALSTREVAEGTGIMWEVCRKHMTRMVQAGDLVRYGQTGSHRYNVTPRRGHADHP